VLQRLAECLADISVVAAVADDGDDVADTSYDVA